MLVGFTLQLIGSALFEVLAGEFAGALVGQIAGQVAGQAFRGRADGRARSDDRQAPRPLQVLASVRIVSQTTGRARIAVAGLRGDPPLAEQLAATLREKPGVRSAEASARTGRLLIHFDPTLMVPETLVRTLERSRSARLARRGRSVQPLAAAI